MHVHLMDPDRDTDPGQPDADLPARLRDLVQDLQLDVLIDAMAGGDRLIGEVARAAILAGGATPQRARYRLEVLADAETCPDAMRELYAIAGRALAEDRALWVFASGHPELDLTRSQRLLTRLTTALEELRGLVDAYGARFASAGLRALCATVRRLLPDDYLADLRELLAVLGRETGVLMHAGLAPGGELTDLRLRVVQRVGRFFPHYALRGPTYVFTLPERDQAGFDALRTLRDRALWSVARAADEAGEQVRAFFVALRRQTAFYLGWLNLRERLAAAGMAVCRPDPRADRDVFRARGLYDPCLVLRSGAGVVPNDVDTRGHRLLVVTGANHGGKTTLLRAIGLAQLLADAGGYVPATSLACSSATGVLTHWAREEDAGMRHGKLDEELARMSDLVDRVRPGSMVLSNESFSSTNEAEASQVGLDVFRALVDAGVRVVVVTHLYDLAETLHTTGRPPAVFLRAERGADGERTYRLSAGPPLPTAYARDLYRREFGDDLPDDPEGLAGPPRVP